MHDAGQDFARTFVAVLGMLAVHHGDTPARGRDVG